MVMAVLIFRHLKTASNKGHVTELCLYSCRHSPRSPSCKILVQRYVLVKATAPMHHCDQYKLQPCSQRTINFEGSPISASVKTLQSPSLQSISLTYLIP